MLKNHEKLTMLNKVLNLEAWLTSYLANDQDLPLDQLYNPSRYELLTAISRGLSSIKAIIKKA